MVIVVFSMHLYQCTVPLVASSLQSGRIWAKLTASILPCEFVGVQVILNRFHPCNTRSPQRFLPVYKWWLKLECACGIYIIIHSGNIPEQGQTPCLGDFSECTLIGSALYFVIGDKVVPFNSKEHTEAPLVENIDPACIPLGDCLTFWTV